MTDKVEWMYCFTNAQISERPLDQAAPFMCLNCNYYDICLGKAAKPVNEKTKDYIEKMHHAKISFGENGSFRIEAIT